MQNNKVNKITIYTDGSCLGNPGPGGWGAVIRQNSQETVLKGGDSDTTNNRMEMIAIIEALKWIKNHAEQKNIDIYSDSSLILNSINKGWKRKKNLDLWEQLDNLNYELKENGFKVNWNWVKGHAGNPLNEKVDAIAVEESEKRMNFPSAKLSKSKKTEDGKYLCRNCGGQTKGVLSFMPDSKMIRVDCVKCGNYIRFAEKTSENLKRAKKKVLITKSQLEDVAEIMKKRGQNITENDLKKIKKWTKEEAKKFINGDQTLF